MTHPEITNAFDPLDGIIAEYLQAIEAGKAPSREAWLAQHPEHSERLRAFLRDWDAVGQDASKFKLPASIGDGETVGFVSTTSLPTLRYLGDYELVSEIARGGMGVVYRARQVSLNRTVAIKMILAGTYATAQAVQRFRAEAEAAANLDHPNILPIYEVGEYEGHQYFSMKLVEGGSLSGKIDELKSQPKQIASLMATLARAVHFAHQRGILHRDLKPANVLLDQDGTPFITDFGLAKKVNEDDGSTRTGSIVGTPSYMAPEQARGEKGLTTSVDIYSLGAILYEMLTGKPPFKGETVYATVKMVLEQEPAKPEGDRDLGVIALKCLSKETGKRYASALELAEDLERWTRGEAITARPVGRVEKVSKWVWRNKAISAFAIIAMIAPIIVIAILVISQQQVRTALIQQKEATEKLSLSLDSERTVSYISRIALAESERVALELDRAESILEECPEDLRRWEWYHLKRLTRPYQHRVMIDSYTETGSFEWIDSNRLICETGKKPINSGELYTQEHATALRIVDLTTQRPVETVGIIRAPFAIDPTRTWLVGVDQSSDIFKGKAVLAVRNLKTGVTHRGFDQHSYNIQELAISPDGQRVASLVSTGTTTFLGNTFTKKAGDDLAIWETATGKLICRVANVTSPMSFSPDGRILYAMATRPTPIWEENRLVKIDAVTGARVNDASPWIAEVRGASKFAIRPDGKFLAMIRNDLVLVWNLESGKRVYQGTEPASAIAFHPIKNQLAFLNPDRKQIQFLDLSTLRIAATYSGADVRKDRSIRPDLRFSPDGKRFALNGPEMDLRVWATDGTSGMQSFSFEAGSSNGITRVIFDEKSTKLAFTGPYLKAELFPIAARPKTSPKRGDALAQLDRFEITHAIPSMLHDTVDWSFIPGTSDLLMLGETTMAPDRVKPGGWVNSAVLTYEVRRYSPDQGKPIWSKEYPKGRSHTSLSLSPNGKRFVTGWKEGFLIGSVETGETLLEGSGPAELVCWSPSDHYFAACAGSLATEVVLFSTEDGRELRRLKEARPSGNGSSDALPGKLVISPDGRKVVFADGNHSRDDDGGHERRISIWDASTGEKTLTLAGHPGGVNSIAFTPDGSRLVSGGSDLLVRIWDLKSGRQVHQLRGPTSWVRGVAVSPDGRYIAATDGWSCRVWDGSK